jgi:diguanylate cyclase (GGDEF)-like protein
MMETTISYARLNKSEYDFVISINLLTTKVHKPLSIKQIIKSARIITLTYVVSLTLITSLSIIVYFSLDKIIVEQSADPKPINVHGQQHKVNNDLIKEELRDSQQLALIIIILSVLITSLVIARTLLTKSGSYAKNSQQEANHDYLTNLLNRRSFNVLAEQCVAISKRYSSDFSIVSFDIDHFKSINEQYGQELGDMVIQNVAETIQDNCRDSDSVFRFDGEAFLILLPQTSETEAIKLANKIRNKIASAPTFSDKLIIEITVSGGVAQWQKQEADIESALNRADKALFSAKEQGRDRVISV